MILGQLCVETMRLEYLTRVIQPVTLRGATDCEIEGLAYDSRQVRPGFLFVALLLLAVAASVSSAGEPL